MIHPLTFLKGAGLGAGIMYFFDPISGNRRRALVKDQIAHACNTCNRQAGVVYRDASNRLEGAKHEISSMMQQSDQGLAERVQEGAMSVGRTLGMQGENWSPTARAAAMLAGAGLAASFLNKSDLAAIALGAVGLTFVANEMANREAMRSGHRQMQSSGQQSERKNQPSQSKKTDASNLDQAKKSDMEAGLEASVPTEKQVVHNL